jgi:hypothetical protein
VCLVEHVLWIGGPPGAGKTEVATRLVRRHGLRLYSADTRTWAHRDRALAEGSAAAQRWERLSRLERESLPAAELLETSLHRERGSMVVDDVKALPPSPLVLAEGSVIVPSCVPDLSRAVWLLPTRAEQRKHLLERDAAAVRLYLLLAAEIERETGALDAPTLLLDGSESLADMVNAVERLFQDVLDAGPTAGTAEERRALLREANFARVEQVRSYYARPWAEGEADPLARTFVCECGDPDCEANVSASVGEAAAGPLLAPGH